MIKLQKTAKILLMGNLVTNLVTESRVGEIRDNTISMALSMTSMTNSNSHISEKLDDINNKIGRR